MSNEKNFWKSVEAISDQQRQIPSEIRRMSGVPKQTFHADRLPSDVSSSQRTSKQSAPPGTKDHDPAPPCPIDGSERYWSDYWTDELVPICIVCVQIAAGGDSTRRRRE
jgi:hypothetical protein